MRSLNWWNDKPSSVGGVVAVHAPGFGRRCLAVIELMEPDYRAGIDGNLMASIRLVRVAKNRAGWKVGNKTILYTSWLSASTLD